MLHYQHRNVRNRLLLWAKLLLVSLFSHLVFFGWLFYIYRSDLDVISLTLRQKSNYSLPVFFVSQAPEDQHKASKKTDNLATKVISCTKNNVQKKNIKKENTQIKTLTTEKKSAEKTEKKNTEKSTGDSEKKDEKPKSNSQPLVPEKEKPSQLNTQRQDAIISTNYREVEALRRGIILQKEIAKNWKPPRGMPETCSCDITAMIGINGKIVNLKIDKSSGILMYDMSARQAFFGVSIPEWAYGKSISVSFKQ